MSVLVTKPVPHDLVDGEPLHATQQINAAIIAQFEAAGRDVGVDDCHGIDGIHEQQRRSQEIEGMLILPQGVKVVSPHKALIPSLLHFLSSMESFLE